MKINILRSLFLFSAFSFAQNSLPVEDINNWQHQNFQKTKIYGVGSTEAHLKLKSLKMTPTPLVVAVIDSGVDAMHQDLKDNMWINKKEIPNNSIDDDNNGYIDDINGWNFIGGANGQNVIGDTFEITRLYMEYKSLFESTDSIKNKTLKNQYSEKYKEYQSIKEKFLKKSTVANREYKRFEEVYSDYNLKFEKITPYFAGKKLSKENLDAFLARTDIDVELKKSSESIAYYIKQDPEAANTTFEEFKESVLDNLKEGMDYHSAAAKYHYNTEIDTRKIIGDNYQNLTEKGYGNNEIKGPDAMHGTHVAGIISGIRGNYKGMEGIAGNHVKIMSVRAVPDGDERDKDVANAIFYAVDNGAKIINMSFGKGYSPNKERVWEAFKYADSKGVLLVHAAGNENEDNDTIENFPTNFPVKGEAKKVVESFITVGASTVSPSELKASFSNFGKNEVDIFAPGSEIYSTTPDNQFKSLQGTSMASPVVAGCAALLWSYFPKLTANDVKKILLVTANKNEQLTEKSVSGGVVDVYQAIEFALKNHKTMTK